jgi:hypothetical protein
LISNEASAQLVQPDRLEIPISRNESPYRIFSAKESGLLLFRTLTRPTEGLQLIHVDTSFRQKWGGIIPLESKMTLAHHKGDTEKAYLLFHKSDFSEINFTVYEIKLNNGNYSRYAIRNYIPFYPTVMEVTSRGILVGGYFLGKIPVILFYDLFTQRSKVLPGLFNEAGELIQIKNNPDDSFSIIINARNQNKQRTLRVKNYTANGDLINASVLEPEENISLLFGRIINESTDRQLIAGVYGARNSDYSKGIFLARIDEEAEQEMRYFPFTDLENFFKFMRANRESRVKQRIERKKIRGKKIRFQYRFLVHEFVSYNDEYILLGEAFYPKYKTIEQNLVYGLAPGRALIFDGYQYTHAVVLGFDQSGNLLWDNSFEINDVRTFTLQQYVKMSVKDDKIALLYLYDDQVRSKIIQDNRVLEDKNYSRLNVNLSDTFAEDNLNITSLDYWYKDRFLAYGVQVVPEGKGGNRKRQVFFVNKVRYQ